MIDDVRLLLIRHAESVNNRTEALTGAGANRVPDPELTELGTEQARLLADHFAAGELPRPDIMFTSLMRRAVATAAPVAEALDIPLQGHGDLFEVNGIYEGVYTGFSTRGIPGPGSPASLLRGLSPRLVLPSYADETGWYRRPFETPAMAWERARTVIDDLVSEFGDGDKLVAVVTHAWFIQFLLRRLMAWPPASDGALGTWLEINNTGHTLLRPSRDEEHSLVLQWLNRLDHLRHAEVSR